MRHLRVLGSVSGWTKPEEGSLSHEGTAPSGGQMEDRPTEGAAQASAPCLGWDGFHSVCSPRPVGSGRKGSGAASRGVWT